MARKSWNFYPQCTVLAAKVGPSCARAPNSHRSLGMAGTYVVRDGKVVRLEDDEGQSVRHLRPKIGSDAGDYSQVCCKVCFIV